MPVAIEAMTDSVKVLLRKSVSGMSGSLERSSTMSASHGRMVPSSRSAASQPTEGLRRSYAVKRPGL